MKSRIKPSKNIQGMRGQPNPTMAQRVSADQAYLRLPEAQKLPPKSAFQGLSSSVDDYILRYLSGTPQPGELAKKGPRVTKGKR